MTLFGIIIGIATIIAALPLIVRYLIIKPYRFVNNEVFNKDITYRVLNHKIQGKLWTTTIKIAYTGKGQEFINRIHFFYQLNMPGPIYGYYEYLNLATGYLTCNMMGLTTLLGTEYNRWGFPSVHRWKISKFLRNSMSFLFGLYLFYMILLMTFSIIGLWVPFSGPFGKFALENSDSDLIITDENGSPVILPKIINPGTEITLECKYQMRLNAKGFRPETPYKFLRRYPKATFCPPKPGNFVWVGRGNIHIFWESSKQNNRKIWQYRKSRAWIGNISSILRYLQEGRTSTFTNFTKLML